MSLFTSFAQVQDALDWLSGIVSEVGGNATGTFLQIDDSLLHLTGVVRNMGGNLSGGQERLSGIYFNLSGRVDDLETRVLDNEKIIIGLPSKSDFISLSRTLTNQFNTVDTKATDNKESVDDLTTYIVNLKLSHNALDTDFRNHTGGYAASGHLGLTGTYSSEL